MKWVSKTATVMGNVIVEDQVSIYYHSSIRCENSSIRIGKGTNIQDNCVCHSDFGADVNIGEYVTIGHGCIIHGCQIGDCSMIGMGSIVMNHAQIGKNCMIGAGSLVTERTIIPDYSVAFGSPCKVVRTLREEEIEKIKQNAMMYIDEMAWHLEQEKHLEKSE